MTKLIDMGLSTRLYANQANFNHSASKAEKVKITQIYDAVAPAQPGDIDVLANLKGHK